MTTRMNRTLCALMAATALVAGVAGCATPVVLGGDILGRKKMAHGLKRLDTDFLNT